MRERNKELEKKVSEIGGTTGGESEGVDLKSGKRGGGRIVKNRLTEIEKRIEMRKREKRRRNIIINGVDVKEGKRREAVKKTLKMIGVKTERLEEIRKLGGEEGKDGEILIILKERRHKKERL